ncbi:MAG: glycosyltransferase N-terminal domain-containing protein [Bacteroidaceae bacterium]
MVYNIILYFYAFCAHVVALFQHKVALMVQGQRNTFPLLQERLVKDAPYIWFHAASLGEFEQGRPLMERLRATYPQYKLLLTFFSPSGYEVRKNYGGADLVCYLPFDTPGHARRFVEMVKPKMVFFIKYEFWMNYLCALRQNNIPLYSVSSIFRPDQLFFRSYGKSYVKALRCFTHFFVQNEASKRLLGQLSIDQVTIVGDTRFDRVVDIRNEAKDVPIMSAFNPQGCKVLVVGSSWTPDENMLLPYFNAHPELKLVLAPHVVTEEHLVEIEQKLQRPAVRFTKASPERIAQADCLIMDCYGLLSSIYRYGTVAYVGGGFGVGIHNVPEAAVYGVPVLIGPNNKRFQEAQALLKCGGCMEVDSAASFETLMNALLQDEKKIEAAGNASARYIQAHAGATARVFEKCFHSCTF